MKDEVHGKRTSSAVRLSTCFAVLGQCHFIPEGVQTGLMVKTIFCMVILKLCKLGNQMNSDVFN